MKKIIVLILFLIPTIIFAESSDNFLGLWYTQDDESIIEIYKNDDNEYFGKIVWLKDPLDDFGKPLTDTENPDVNKRNNPLIDLVILKRFIITSSLSLRDGTIYDPENGKTYNCIIKLKESNLIIRGYIGISLFGRSETWRKCSSIPENLDKTRSNLLRNE